VSFHTILGYLSGLYFIKPDLDAAALLRTTAVVHLLDAVLCALIAGQSGRNKKIWAAAGLLLGIWGLATLFVLPAKKNNFLPRVH
jgi:hypothetical protein